MGFDRTNRDHQRALKQFCDFLTKTGLTEMYLVRVNMRVSVWVPFIGVGNKL
jgi:hypothetical protein